MSALRQRSTAPTFTTYTEVEVDIDPHELELEGWIYVGKSKSGESRLALLVREMHEDEHEGPMRWCQHGCCRAVDGDAS